MQLAPPPAAQRPELGGPGPRLARDGHGIALEKIVELGDLSVGTQPNQFPADFEVRDLRDPHDRFERSVPMMAGPAQGLPVGGSRPGTQQAQDAGVEQDGSGHDQYNPSNSGR